MDGAEKRLIRKCQKGDRSVYFEFTRRYSPLVWKIAYHFARNRQEAEDLTQDAFLHVFRNLAKFRFRSAFSTWLYRVVWNYCLNLVQRSKHRYMEVAVPDGAPEDRAPVSSCPFPAPDQTVEEAEKEDILRKAVESLDPRYRSVLLLYYFNEVSYQEIAKVMGIPIGTVKTYLFRGKEALRAELTDKLGVGYEEQLC